MEEQIITIEWNEVARQGMRRMKQWLKDNCIKIRKEKSSFKNKQRDGGLTYNDFTSLWKIRNEYRHNHIAYSELRGKTREEIEKPAEGNYPSDRKIQEIKDNILAGMK